MNTYIDKKNIRAYKMWGFILPALARLAGTQASEPGRQLAGMSIVDFGSGYGDIAINAVLNGSRTVLCLDKDYENLRTISEKSREMGIYAFGPILLIRDLNDVAGLRDDWRNNFDVGICTSVLPYLEYPNEFLKFMSESCTSAIIECQYAGDGPGFVSIEGDDDMRNWLEKYWSRVEVIGKTLVEGRNVHRTIWLCTGGQERE